MRISTVREFRDQATGLLRSKDSILVTRRGRIAGVFFPCPGQSIPLELKREMFAILNPDCHVLLNIDKNCGWRRVENPSVENKGVRRIPMGFSWSFAGQRP